MIEELQERLARILDLTNQLAETTSDQSLRMRLGQSRSNAIGEQFWCVVGARESYAAAIREASWQGFSCSLYSETVFKYSSVVDAMRDSNATVFATISGISDLDTARLKFVLDLWEHEAQHQGQLIRYFYANDIAFPEEFRQRYNLEL